ncbi:MAG: hypothetical protein K9N23_18310 [Akkermansiaceae bacterium]|nr:hypothetical protein [Akkermansiaceae bacterium]
MNITEDPIPHLIRRIAVPASVGFFFNTRYNFVDTYFGGKISTDALAALSLSFPLFFIILAVGSGIGQGTTALIANAIGAGDEEKGGTVLVQAISFSVLSGIILTVAGFIGGRPWAPSRRHERPIFSISPAAKTQPQSAPGTSTMTICLREPPNTSFRS